MSVGGAVGVDDVYHLDVGGGDRGNGDGVGTGDDAGCSCGCS